jgi:hypothetical protein
MWRAEYQTAPGATYMHDLIIALAFIGLVVAPAVAAARVSGDR